MAWWLIVAVIIIAALMLIMLLSPVIISVDSVRSGGKVDGSLNISWLMLLIRYALKDRQIEIFAFDRRIVRRSDKEKLPVSEDLKKPKRHKKQKPRRMPPVKHIFNLAGPLMRLFKDLVAAFRLRYIDIGITYGLNDPAYTGILTGFLYAVGGSLQIGHKIGRNIRFTPDFMEPILDWKLRAKASITPVRIVPPVARFVTSRQVLRSGWRIIRG